MDTSAHLTHLRADGAALAAAARHGTEAAVESCPGWSVADLVEHVGRVHRWVVRSFDSPTDARVQWVADDDPDPGADLAEWYEERLGELLGRFDTDDLDREVATFLGPRPMRWWARRQAQETSIHRWDGQSAHGTPGAIDPALASDGVDEYLTVFMRRWGKQLPTDGSTVHLHCTDVEGEWLVRFAADGPEVERAHAKGDVAVRGPAEQLDLLLWNRVAPSAVELLGDAGAYERSFGAIANG